MLLLLNEMSNSPENQSAVLIEARQVTTSFLMDNGSIVDEVPLSAVTTLSTTITPLSPFVVGSLTKNRSAESDSYLGSPAVYDWLVAITVLLILTLLILLLHCLLYLRRRKSQGRYSPPQIPEFLATETTRKVLCLSRDNLYSTENNVCRLFCNLVAPRLCGCSPEPNHTQRKTNWLFLQSRLCFGSFNPWSAWSTRYWYSSRISKQQTWNGVCSEWRRTYWWRAIPGEKTTTWSDARTSTGNISHQLLIFQHSFTTQYSNFKRESIMIIVFFRVVPYRPDSPITTLQWQIGLFKLSPAALSTKTTLIDYVDKSIFLLRLYKIFHCAVTSTSTAKKIWNKFRSVCMYTCK